jgi:hypothetical protein
VKEYMKGRVVGEVARKIILISRVSPFRPSGTSSIDMKVINWRELVAVHRGGGVAIFCLMAKCKMWMSLCQACYSSRCSFTQFGRWRVVDTAYPLRKPIVYF